MNKYAPIYLLAFFTFSLNAQDVTSFFSKTDNFLNTYVENGAVAYKKIHSNPSELNEILNMIETLSITRDDDCL